MAKGDELYLPVDAVITAIFKKMDPTRSWNFKSINHLIKEHYKGDEIEVWDDLWFWGFFTQKVEEKQRSFEWNEYKYWAMKETDKDVVVMGEIKKKAKEFLEVLSTKKYYEK